MNIFDPIRKKFVVLTPEEWVRQNFIRYLNEEKNYPLSLMAPEAGMKVHRLQKRSDILVYNRNGKIAGLVECKAPEVKISTKAFDQILRYNIALEAQYLMVTNGLTHFCIRVGQPGGAPEVLNEIPEFSRLIS